MYDVYVILLCLSVTLVGTHLKRSPKGSVMIYIKYRPMIAVNVAPCINNIIPIWPSNLETRSPSSPSLALITDSPFW